mgnify:FL=1|tara:strand:+ start:12315 stop:12614 length:300 start_codon:yes stop_codon:yes gene_type:complete
MKHIDTWGQIDTLRYANQISKIKRHKERLDYIKDVPKKYHQLIYLLAMQMRLPQTISELPTREERKKAWEELPEHNKTLKGMKNMVYHRVVRIFKNERC